ncbi:WAS/WASL-interacting protein family member 3-like [Lolium rigidum]|uniref:WAS/WASL-interacting protein family member 3-like n=1 Tax=Lolium rigidum TaxID=89674 RepID=UPI001F5E1558|nr:WAS/WASL-interacting protein family member 3-like [Lolium rigidum]
MDPIANAKSRLLEAKAKARLMDDDVKYRLLEAEAKVMAEENRIMLIDLDTISDAEQRAWIEKKSGILNSKGGDTMRYLCFVTSLAILFISNVRLGVTARLLAEIPNGAQPIPNIQPGAPAPLPPPVLPGNTPANLPVDNLPGNLPANLPGNLPANLPANVPPGMLANVPPAMLATVPPEMLAKLSGNVTPEMLSKIPPDVLAKIPPGQLPPDVTPEMIATLASMKQQQQQQQGQPAAGAAQNNAAAAGAAGLPIPKMPDFAGLANISFPPMPSASLPQMPENVTLFGFDVKIPKFINKMVNEHTES